MPAKPDPTEQWLTWSVVSFGLGLVALYLAQGLPSLLYVLLVLGLLGFSFAAFVIHHHLQLWSLGRRLAALARGDRRRAWLFLVLGAVGIGLKLLGVW